MQLYAHQQETADFLERTPRAFITSDPGTGKTLSILEGFRRDPNPNKKMLVLAPLSILKPSWGGDISRFTNFSYEIAHGEPAKRTAKLQSNTSIVITNHDAVNWLVQHPETISSFTHLVIDEFPAFKNRTSRRSKAIRQLTSRIPKLWMASGTPNSNTILDIWYPAFLLDSGQRLGRNFFQFRNQACAPVQVGPRIQHIQWRDKPGIEEEVADLLKDVTIRFKFEECITIPPNSKTSITISMPAWLRHKYNMLLHHAFLESLEGNVTGINAGAKVRKILQLLSGAVYSDDGEPVRVHTERYELVMELVSARTQSIVAFNYRHERENLVQLAEAMGIPYGVIDGSISSINERNRTVEAFQRGELRVLFIHPKSGGHGLTLTAGRTTIWCSPTYDAELYQQLNRRIYRAGQTQRTETIRIAYEDSEEIKVYDRLDEKLHRMDDLLELFRSYSHAA